MHIIPFPTKQIVTFALSGIENVATEISKRRTQMAALTAKADTSEFTLTDYSNVRTLENEITCLENIIDALVSNSPVKRTDSPPFEEYSQELSGE